MIWSSIDNIQKILFPINNNDNVFIYPYHIKYKLPSKAIDIIRPSQKYIAPYPIQKLLSPKWYHSHKFFNIPYFHIPTIQQLMMNTCLDPNKNENKNFKNHFFTENTAETVIDYILNDYVYGKPLSTHHQPKHNNTNEFLLFLFRNTNCTIETINNFEDNYNVKYVITDKCLGPGIVDRDIFSKIELIEINKMLKRINYNHNPAQLGYCNRICIQIFQNTQ